MLLRDGGKYVNRLGEVVTVKWRGNLAYPFTDLSEVHTYDENGLVFDLNDPSDEDLVAEYKETEDSISKAALAEYIRNRLAVLEHRASTEGLTSSIIAEARIEALIELCEEFDIITE